MIAAIRSCFAGIRKCFRSLRHPYALRVASKPSEESTTSSRASVQLKSYAKGVEKRATVLEFRDSDPYALHHARYVTKFTRTDAKCVTPNARVVQRST